MDLLYSRYSSPLEFMRLYIEQGRLDEFVTEIIEHEDKRKQKEAEEKEERKLWELYLHSFSDKSFIDWKAQALSATPKETNNKPQTLSMTDAEVDNAKEKARDMLKRFKMNY